MQGECGARKDNIYLIYITSSIFEYDQAADKALVTAVAALTKWPTRLPQAHSYRNGDGDVRPVAIVHE
jgi:hypothetical protein